MRTYVVLKTFAIRGAECRLPSRQVSYLNALPTQLKGMASITMLAFYRSIFG